MDIYEKLEQMQLTLPPVPPEGGTYSPTKRLNGTSVFVSGCGPVIDGPVRGRLGKDVSVEAGQDYARNCMLNVLSVLQAGIGDLRKIKSVAKILTFVQCTEDFEQQASVANGGTQLLVDLLGASVGLPARSAIGVYALPGGIPVETEAIFEIAE
ncbi:MAG: RidA family protein [Clostridiales bacterium]|nr:RidA family protein [Clostridiales bacterium]